MHRRREGLPAEGAANDAARPEITNPTPFFGSSTRAPSQERRFRVVKDLFSWTTWAEKRPIALIIGALVLLSVGVSLATASSFGGSNKTTVLSPAVAKGIAATGQQAGNGNGHVIVGHSVKNDKSPALRTITPKPMTPQPNHPARQNPPILHQHTNRKDPAVQNNLAAPKMPGTQLNFDGISFPGVDCNCAPPDTNGEVGATQYVQIVNTGLQVFDKTTGTSVLGPVSISTLWSGFGGVCETNGFGDPVVLYDQLANRWIVTPVRGNEHPDRTSASRSRPRATRRASYNRYDFDLGLHSGQLLRLPEARRVAGCLLHEHERVQRVGHGVPRPAAVRSRSRGDAHRQPAADDHQHGHARPDGRPAHAGRPGRVEPAAFGRAEPVHRDRDECRPGSSGASTSTSATPANSTFTLGRQPRSGAVQRRLRRRELRAAGREPATRSTRSATAACSGTPTAASRTATRRSSGT